MTGIINHYIVQENESELKIIHTSTFSFQSMRQVDALPMRTDMCKNWGRQNNILKFKCTSENVGKDELSDISFHLRLGKLFHHSFISLHNESKVT
jgi:hypothetical protein